MRSTLLRKHHEQGRKQKVKEALQQLTAGKMEDDGPFSAGVSQFDVDVDVAFERAEQEATMWIGDGHFIDQSWVNQGTDNAIEATVERPAILHTCLRHPASVPEAGKSFAHDCHPFVAFVHLLRNARQGSEVYMSIPYLSDFTVIDQLCHYADPAYGGLQIYIVLGPKTWNVECLERFVGRSQSRETALARLHIKRFGRDDGSAAASFCHSKAMVSSAGVMIGSYNFTNAARLRHTEHGVLLGVDFDSSGLLAELQNLWRQAPEPAVTITRVPSPARFIPPADGSIYNPYAKRPRQG
jgi:PLD-like domain